MGQQPPRIVLVEPDATTLQTLVLLLVRRFDAHVTCVSEAKSCLDVEMVQPHELVIAEFDLPDMNGLALAGQLMALSNRPVILLADAPTCDQVMEAMRTGVADFFRKPVPEELLVDSAQRALRALELGRNWAARYRRMHDLVRCVIRERRELNSRMDLVCRDLVGAQRRLVQRVLAMDAGRPHEPL